MDVCRARPLVAGGVGMPCRSPAVVVAGLASCSQSAPGPDQTAQDFLRALGAKDTAAACSVVAFDGQPLSGDDVLLCRTGYDTLVNEVIPADQLAQLRSATVTGVSVDGDTATIPDGQIPADLAAYLGDIGLVRVNQRWYVNTEP
ncbi:MAG: hypothetical protein WCG47_09315 [Dermatophilaceae bacterium]